MKTYKKRILMPNTEEEKTVTIYEVIGKFGTQATTIFYLLEKPEKGKYVFGSCDELHCNPKLPSFKYTDWKYLSIWNYSEENDYWYISY